MRGIVAPNRTFESLTKVQALGNHDSTNTDTGHLEDSDTGPTRGQFAASDGHPRCEDKPESQKPPNSLHDALDTLWRNQMLSSTAIERALQYCTLPHVRCLDSSYFDLKNPGLVHEKSHKGHIGYKTFEKIVVLVCPGNAPDVKDYAFRTHRAFVMVYRMSGSL